MSAAGHASTSARALPDAALDTLFRQARTHNAWEPREVPDAMLRELYDLWKWGATASNGGPARVIFVRTPDGKARLAPCLSPANVSKMMSAPVTAIIGYDVAFHRHLPRLFAHNPKARDGFVGEENAERARTTAFRNSSLQGGYLMLAARALGLDCGPMSGFDHAAVDADFWANTTVRTNFLCNLGYGDASALFPRQPRLNFEECCTLA